MSRSLAHIEKIEWIEPIKDRDRIELAGVLGWQVIVKKDEFKVGDLCIYVEVDSIMPERAEVNSKHPDWYFRCGINFLEKDPQWFIENGYKQFVKKKYLKD
jgi:hypothetical protein